MSVTIPAGLPHVDQRILYKQLRLAFPNAVIHTDVKKKINIKYHSSGSSYMQIDVWMPTFQLCFEFQDSYHYTSVWYYNSPQEQIHNKDSEKKELATRQGMSFIVVPCWWDSSVESLESTILFQRPDLAEHISGNHQSICLNPPLDFFKSTDIPEIGELMLASFQLLDRFHIDDDFKWWLGEKYDGTRFCWNSSERKLYSRHAREFVALMPLYEHFPKIFVDGEIWFGRGQFACTYSLLNEEPIQWPFLRAIVFDIPSITFEQLPFEPRYAKLLTSFRANHPFALVAPRTACDNDGQLRFFLENTIHDGGEGVIVQRIGSKYERGRSPVLFKLKSFEDDKEAVVLALEDDNSVLLKLPDGSTFAVPAENVLALDLEIGDVVTFSFERNSRSDVPTNPKIFRVRKDLSWDDVLQSHRNDSRYLEASPKQIAARQTGYWTAKTMRVHMENYARSRDLDPLLAETWHSSFFGVSRSRVGKMILGKFKSDYVSTRKNLFPDATDPPSFQSAPWSKIENRRIFFEVYAQKRGFDALIPDHWYLQSTAQIMAEKGAQTIVLYHNDDLVSTIVDLFPNIGLDHIKLKFHLRAWSNPEKRKKFFEQYATLHGFDPHDPIQWYKQSISPILAFKGAKRVISYHNNSVAQSLLDLFPDIGLDSAKLAHLENWHSSETNRRIFFDSYARAHKFDPLVSDHWYSQTRSQILSHKGSASVLSYYNSSISRALLQLYPDVNFSRKKLFKCFSLWGNARKRRVFFERYAKMHEFNPLVPENWYSQSKEAILTAKGARGVLFYHGGSLAKALMDLFPEIGFSFSKFKSAQSTFWNNPAKQREFFVKYALERRFDPLNPEDWYMQSKRDILAQKGARSITHYHGDSVTQALLKLFPNINLDENKLHYRKINWGNADVRRKFLVDFAQEHGFDPLVASNWNAARRKRILMLKNTRHVLVHHKNSLKTALQELFPAPG